MKNVIFAFGLFVFVAYPLVALSGEKSEQESKTAKTSSIIADGGISEYQTTEVADTHVEDSKSPAPENTLDSCKDEFDNDFDGFVDCADQDCQIFAMCVGKVELQRQKELDPGSEGETQAIRDEREADTNGVLTHRPFSLGFVPGLTTDSAASNKVVNNFSLNFIGWGDYLRGAEFSLIGAVRKNDVSGFQGAGIFNHTSGNVQGFQGSGIINITWKNMQGFQGTGIANVVGGDGQGFFGAGISNVTAGNLAGFQGSGIGNVTGGRLVGFQGAGIANVAGAGVEGFQGAGIVNVTGGDLEGFQGAGIANVTVGNVEGVQAAGITNVTTGHMHGLQVGLINYGTHVRGAQIGLVNIATKEMKGAPIGLINYAGDGVLAPTVWSSPSSMINTGLKMGSKHVYSLLAFGLHPVGDEKRISFIAGLGGHVDISKRLWLEVDGLHHNLHAYGSSIADDDIDFLEQFRVNLGFRLGGSVSLYGGPSLNILISDVRRTVGFGGVFYRETSHDGTTVALSPGLTFGVQWQPKVGKLNNL